MAVSLNGNGTITGLSTLDSVTITGLTSLTTTDLTADTTTLVVDSANDRVGIGTSSPDSKLDVNGVIKIGFASAPTWDTNSYLWSESGVGLNVDGFNLKFSTGVTRNERMRITSTGNVGIGTASPSETLVVIGKTSFGSDWEDNSGTSLDTYQFGSYANAVSAIMIKSTSTGQGALVFSGTNTTRYGFIAYQHNGDYMQFWTNNAERMRIDSSGNVLVGTSSTSAQHPDAKIFVKGGISFEKETTAAEGSTPAITQWSSNGTACDLVIGTRSGTGKVLFYTGNAGSGGDWGASGNVERMRIASDGKVFIGTTSYTGKVNISQSAGDWVIVENSTFAGTQYFTSYRSSGTQIGTITGNGTNVSYNTSSDYRLKNNVAPMSGSIDRLKQLKPSTWSWVQNGSHGEGFLAHEAQEVVPEAVSGTKDEVDDEGNPVYQGIDQSKLVPLLTSALQEAITKIEALEARVATLEGN